MATVHQATGVAIAAWDESDPLVWSMSEPATRIGTQADPIECDLRSLRPVYAEPFLLALKASLIEARHHKQLPSILRECKVLRRTLEIVQQNGFEQEADIQRIGSKFLVALYAVEDQIPASYFGALQRLFKLHRMDETIFDPGLQSSDFPDGRSQRGPAGDRIHRILAKALRRSTLVHILDVAEAAFEEGELDLGRYSFLKLALNIFCRPESYRKILLGDLTSDTDINTGVTDYFLRISPVKSRVRNPAKIPIRLHPDVGQLLEMQRADVVEKFGHLASIAIDSASPELSKLALFPSLKLADDRTRWFSEYANKHSGMLHSTSFVGTYLLPIRKLCSMAITCNVLRHTIGTQLALAGCTAHTIQAVLKHSSPTTASAYVDIAFEGLIDELSDGLQPAFDEHFPVVNSFVSKHSAMPAEKRIDSEDLEIGRKEETTGLCGRLMACHYAPITCYACPRFIPCYDADHRINLDIVERDMQAAQVGGLAMQHEVKRCKTIRNHIRVIMIACDNRRRAIEFESQGVSL